MRVIRDDNLSLSLSLSLSLALVLFTYCSAAWYVSVTVFGPRTIAGNSCRSQGRCPASETVAAERREGPRGDPRRQHPTVMLLRAHEFALSVTPRLQCRRYRFETLEKIGAR